MNRRKFLAAGSLLPLAGVPALQTWGNTGQEKEDELPVIRPAYLKKGDTIGITAPAGFTTLEKMQPAVQLLQTWGYKVQLGDTIGKRDFTYAGTDEERRTDLQRMLDDPSIKAILCARGGYGAVRIIDQLSWTAFKAKPKWIIGFSDITVLHSHLNRKLGIASIHSKMGGGFPADWSQASELQKATILSLQKALSGEKMEYSWTPNKKNKTGTATGTLVGGNLRTLETLTGSASDITTAGKILFVEDTLEYMYSVDRMFWNLKRSGKLANLKALIVGGFNVKPEEDPEDAFGSDLQQIVLEKVKGYSYPVCFDFPVGHQINNFALKCGMVHQLKVLNDACTLTEKI